MTRRAGTKAEKFCNGSPIPIMTTLEITRSLRFKYLLKKCSANQSCETISPAVRLRLNPWCPVEQNLQATAHPAWDEIHKVPLSSSGIKTASTALPPSTSNSHLIVPSLEI